MNLIQIPKKSLGQNFLVDKNIINKIIMIGNIKENKTVLEIGPGYGSLTKKIVSMNPKKIFAIEKDQKLSSFLKKNFTNFENVNIINDLTTNVGIDWFSTPMYSEAIDFLLPYVKRFKIRELDGRLLLENKITPLIQKIIDTKKEVLISVNTLPHTSEFNKNKQIKWLYCVPKYPCDFNDIDFKNIKKFNGYSNHCNDYNAILETVKMGAEIIEIHVTQDKKGNYIDNSVSFDFDECKNIINKIKEIKNN